VANAATTAVGVATGILSVRLLGPVGEGQLTAIQTWPLLFGSLAMLGLPEALVYFISRDPGRSRQLTSTAMILAIVSAIVVGGAAWQLLPLLLSAQPTAVIDAARVFLIIGVIYAVTGVPHGALRGAQRFRSWNAFRVAPGLAWLAILCAAWASGRAEPIPLSRWYLVGVAAVGLPFLVIVARSLRGPARPKLELAKPMLRFGLPSVLTTVPQTANVQLDQLLIIALLPARNLGLYVAAVSWSSAITPLLSAVGSVIFPHLSAESDREKQTQILATALRGSLLVGIVVAGILTVAAPIGIPLVFGSRYDGSVASALVLVPAGGVLAWAGVAEEGLRGLGRPGLVLVAEIVGAVITVALLPELLNSLGIFGAAVASLVGYLTVATVCVFAIARATGAPVRTFVLPTRETVKMVVFGSRDILRSRFRRANT
jgi:O-antigen/teichoic acid export membrane protein